MISILFPSLLNRFSKIAIAALTFVFLWTSALPRPVMASEDDPGVTPSRDDCGTWKISSPYPDICPLESHADLGTHVRRLRQQLVAFFKQANFVFGDLWAEIDPATPLYSQKQCMLDTLGDNGPGAAWGSIDNVRNLLLGQGYEVSMMSNGKPGFRPIDPVRYPYSDLADNPYIERLAKAYEILQIMKQSLQDDYKGVKITNRRADWEAAGLDIAGDSSAGFFNPSSPREIQLRTEQKDSSGVYHPQLADCRQMTQDLFHETVHWHDHHSYRQSPLRGPHERFQTEMNAFTLETVAFCLDPSKINGAYPFFTWSGAGGMTYQCPATPAKVDARRVRLAKELFDLRNKKPGRDGSTVCDLRKTIADRFFTEFDTSRQYSGTPGLGEYNFGAALGASWTDSTALDSARAEYMRVACERWVYPDPVGVANKNTTLVYNIQNEGNNKFHYDASFCDDRSCIPIHTVCSRKPGKRKFKCCDESPDMDGGRPYCKRTLKGPPVPDQGRSIVILDNTIRGRGGLQMSSGPSEAIPLDVGPPYGFWVPLDPNEGLDNPPPSEDLPLTPPPPVVTGSGSGATLEIDDVVSSNGVITWKSKIKEADGTVVGTQVNKREPDGTTKICVATDTNCAKPVVEYKGDPSTPPAEGENPIIARNNEMGCDRDEDGDCIDPCSGHVMTEGACSSYRRFCDSHPSHPTCQERAP